MKERLRGMDKRFDIYSEFQRRECERSSVQGDNASDVLELMKDIYLTYTYYKEIAEHQMKRRDLRNNHRKEI